MRVFIAINIPEEIKDYFKIIQEMIDKENVKIRLAHKGQMHLTLKFLGEVQPDMVKKVCEELKNIKFQSFPVYLDSIGIFSSKKYIRVIWIGLRPEEEIIKIQKNIDDILNKCFKREKDFEPHLTLARVKFVEDKEKFVRGLKNIKIKRKKFEINNFKLVKSILTKKGAIYEDIAIFNS